MTLSNTALHLHSYTRDQVRAILPAWIHDVEVVESIASTNTTLKLRNPPHSSCLIAFHQTQGRGTQARQFYCEPYQGLYVSFTLTDLPSFPPSLTIAAAIIRALHDLGYNTSLKWVNDIMIEGKKVGGILCETYPHGMVIGFGLNVSVQHFPLELANTAGSLHQFKDHIESHLVLIKTIFDHFSIFIKHPKLTHMWINAHLCYRHQTVHITYNNRIIEGVSCGINEDGHLEILHNYTTITLNTTVESMTLLEK